MNQNRSHWVRVFKIPYHKQGQTLTREEDVKCEPVKNGLHKPGERTHLAKDTRVTVHLFVPYFDEPKTADEQADIDVLYTQCEREADQYLRKMYPEMEVT